MAFAAAGAVALALLVGTTAGAAAAGEECADLASEDVAFGAPLLEGEMTAADGQDCFVLPDPQATTYVVGMGARLDLRVVDADGETACTLDFLHNSRLTTCTSIGPAPHRLVVTDPYPPETPEAYTVQVLRISSDTGCAPAAVSPFGEGATLTDAGKGTATGGTDPLSCWSLDLEAGQHLMRSETYRAWLVDDAGNQLCRDVRTAAPLCDVEEGGTYSVLARSDGDPQERRVSLIDLAGAECPRVIDASWTAPAVRQDLDEPVQVDCHEVDLGAGDRVVAKVRGVSEPLGAAHGGRTAVVDADGDIACTPTYNSKLSFDACEIEGDGPFRLISWMDRIRPDHDPAYHVAIKSLEDSADCPALGLDSFGSAPADSRSLVGCRRFEAPSSGQVLLESVYLPGPEQPDKHPVVRTKSYLFGDGIDDQCPAFSPGKRVARLCDGLMPGASYLVVNSPLAIPFANGVYDVAETTGCTPLKMDLTAVGRVTAPGSVDCHGMDLKTGEAFDLVSARPSTPGLNAARTTVVDATGRRACSIPPQPKIALDTCRPTGPAPYRVLATSGDGRGAYTTAAARPTVLARCGRIRDGRSVVDLDRNARVACARFPVAGSRTVEVKARTNVQRRTTEGFVLGFKGFANTICRTNGPIYRSRASGNCAPERRRRGSGVMVAVTDGTPQRISFDVTGIEKPVRPLRNKKRPKIKGARRAGKKLRVTKGRWKPKPDAYAYQWYVNGRALKGRTKRKFKVKRWMRGKRIDAVVIVGKRGTEAKHKFAKPVRIKRR